VPDYVSKSLGTTETVLRRAGIPWTYHLQSWLSLLLLGVVLIGILIFVRMSIWISTTEFALTDRRVIYKTGWLSRKTEELALSSIEEVEVRQGFWGRAFGFGRLVLSGAGAGEVSSPPIADPVGFRAALSDARAAFREA